MSPPSASADDPVVHISSPAEWSATLAANQYVVADFSAEWCGPCKAVAPYYEQLARAHSIPAFLAFAKIDVDKVQPVAQQYGVRAMPTFMWFKDGVSVKAEGVLAVQGADVRALTRSVEKMARLAREKKEKVDLDAAAAAAAGGGATEGQGGGTPKI
jgi:thioredoxin 1